MAETKSADSVSGVPLRYPYVIIIASAPVNISVAAPATTLAASSNTDRRSIHRRSPPLLSVPCPHRSRCSCYPLAHICICLYSTETSVLVQNLTFPPPPCSLVRPSRHHHIYIIPESLPPFAVPHCPAYPLCLHPPTLYI